MTMTKFYGGLDKQSFLVHGISLNNPKQIGADYRLQYLSLIKKHQIQLAGHLELLGDEIYSFYQDNQEKTKSIVKQWQKQCHQSTSPIFWQWQKLSETKVYQQFLEAIKKAYQEDTVFKKIVDELVKKHAFKKSSDAALNYILHECAGFLILPQLIRSKFKLEKNISIVFIYPAREFNPAVMYQIKKCQSELRYKGYQLKLPEKEKLFKQCLSLKTALNEHHISEEKHLDFVSEVFKLIKEYQSHKGKSDYEIDKKIKKGFFSIGEL